jgi:hypothetical protein
LDRGKAEPPHLGSSLAVGGGGPRCCAADPSRSSTFVVDHSQPESPVPRRRRGGRNPNPEGGSRVAVGGCARRIQSEGEGGAEGGDLVRVLRAARGRRNRPGSAGEGDGGEDSARERRERAQLCSATRALSLSFSYLLFFLLCFFHFASFFYVKRAVREHARRGPNYFDYHSST